MRDHELSELAARVDRHLAAINLRLVITERAIPLLIFGQTRMLRMLARIDERGLKMVNELTNLTAGMDSLATIVTGIATDVHDAIVLIEKLKSDGAGTIKDTDLDPVLAKLAAVRDSATATKAALDAELAPPPPPPAPPEPPPVA